MIIKPQLLKQPKELVEFNYVGEDHIWIYDISNSYLWKFNSDYVCCHEGQASFEEIMAIPGIRRYEDHKTPKGSHLENWLNAHGVFCDY